MPLYRVEHAISLTVPQQDELAEAITTIHSNKFTTPRMFVQIEFIDVSNAVCYIGGRRRKTNNIRGNVREGPSRTQKDYDNVCHEINAAWDRIVGPGLPKIRRADPDQDTSLRSVIIIGGLLAGVEAGFTLPSAGNDVNWIQENWADFKKTADSGDVDFQEMVKEVEARGLMPAQTNGH